MTCNAKKCFTATLALLCILLITSCSVNSTPSDSKWVYNNLQGKWERDRLALWPEEDPAATKEKGTLEITYNTITINGPFENLKDYTRGVALEAYTEEVPTEEISTKKGNLYIKDRGEWQPSIPYTYWESAGYPREKMLTINGNTLKKIEE